MRMEVIKERLKEEYESELDTHINNTIEKLNINFL